MESRLSVWWAWDLAWAHGGPCDWVAKAKQHIAAYPWGLSQTIAHSSLLMLNNVASWYEYAITTSVPSPGQNCIVEFGVNGDGLDKVTRYSFQRDLRIHCRAARPEAEVDWFYTNGTKIGSSDRNFREGHYPNGTTVLQIASSRRLRTCDAGTYTCVANCSDGLVQSRNFTLVISSKFGIVNSLGNTRILQCTLCEQSNWQSHAGIYSRLQRLMTSVQIFTGLNVYSSLISTRWWYTVCVYVSHTCATDHVFICYSRAFFVC